MNKPKGQKSAVIQKLQQTRSAAAFEKTKKQMLLAAKIQDAIKAKGLNNIRFAEMMDQHASVISKWLSGTHNFTADTLFDIEEKLGITLINSGEMKKQGLVKKYEFTVSVKAEQLAQYPAPHSFLNTEELIHHHIASCGGMAVTTVNA
jgi:ribosome-binding protein aMBF1 (putative translation factor)